MKIVICECGTQNIAIEGEEYGTFGHKWLWSIKCSHRYCFREAFGNNEEEVIKNWNKRLDWWAHESKSIYSEEEYCKLVEACGGEIVKTPWWIKKKEKPCPHCELRERIKENIMEEINNG